jgi:hypothetical protein
MKLKQLIILYWLLIALSVIIDVGFGKLFMPENLFEFFDNSDYMAYSIVFFVTSIIAIISMPIGSYGIWNNKIFGLPIFIVGNASVAVATIALGYSLASGIGGALCILYCMISGMIIEKSFGIKRLAAQQGDAPEPASPARDLPRWEQI